ncbi:MAG: AgmX/PglI C-terminal domain-containing protein [Myxococcaceae bacterium]|nr:AgmX/PglI C-terminal domain-containing protein [Myxococcaceae bacterium]
MVRASAIMGALLLVGVASGCQPTYKDVAKAEAAKDVRELVRLLHHEETSVHAPAMASLVRLGGPEATSELTRAMQGGSEPQVIDAALGEWPAHVWVLDVVWVEITKASADPQAVERILKVLVAKAPAALGTFISGHLDTLKQNLGDEPARRSALLALADDPLVPVEAATTLANERFIAAAGALKGKPLADVLQQLDAAVSIHGRLSKAEGASGDQACILASALTALLPALVDAPERTDIDARLGTIGDAVCDRDRGKVVTAVLDGLKSLQLGYQPGRKVEVTPAKYCCIYFGECDSVLRTPEQCAQSNDPNGRWAQVKPAEYAPDPAFGPKEDADRLRRAADLLVLLGHVTRRAEHEDLAKSLRVQADLQASGSKTVTDLGQLRQDVDDLKKERSRYLYLKGYIVADVGDNTYEMATVSAVPSCMSFSCPTPPNLRVGKHSILKTTETSFTTKGLFSLWAEKSGEQDIKTKDGFTETWAVFTEVDKSVPKGIEADIETKQKELSALTKNSAATIKKMETDRRQLGLAVDAVDASVLGAAQGSSLPASQESPRKNAGRAGSGGQVDLGEPTIMGSLDKEVIQKVVLANRDRVTACYDAELSRAPGLSGQASAKFVIGADGSVTQAQATKSTLANETLENCLALQVRGWTFPKPKNGGVVVVSFPFVFRSP